MASQLKMIGAAFSYMTVVFNILAGLLYTPWMIPCIGSDHYGLFTLALSIVNFFLLNFGLLSAVVAFLTNLNLSNSNFRRQLLSCCHRKAALHHNSGRDRLENDEADYFHSEGRHLITRGIGLGL